MVSAAKRFFIFLSLFLFSFALFSGTALATGKHYKKNYYKSKHKIIKKIHKHIHKH